MTPVLPRVEGGHDSHERHRRAKDRQRGRGPGEEERENPHQDEREPDAVRRAGRPRRALLGEGVAAMPAARRALTHARLTTRTGLLHRLTLPAGPIPRRGAVTSLACLADVREPMVGRLAVRPDLAATCPARLRGRAPLPSSSAAVREHLLVDPPQLVSKWA